MLPQRPWRQSGLKPRLKPQQERQQFKVTALRPLHTIKDEARDHSGGAGCHGVEQKPANLVATCSCRGNCC